MKVQSSIRDTRPVHAITMGSLSPTIDINNTDDTVQMCKVFDAYIVPLELLNRPMGERQPVSRAEWEIVVNTTITPLINRASLYYSYLLSLCTDRFDVVARHYVQRYIHELSVADTALELRRGMVCELLWIVPNVSMPHWVEFATVVGNPKCSDWSSYAPYFKHQIEYTLNATKHQWNRFPFNMCQHG